MFPIALLLGAGLLWLMSDRQGGERISAENFQPKDFQLSPDGTMAKLTPSGLALLKKKLAERLAEPLTGADGRLMGLDASSPTPKGAMAPALLSVQQVLTSLPGSFAVMTAVGQEGTTNEKLFIGFYQPGSQPQGTTYVGTIDELKAAGFFS